MICREERKGEHIRSGWRISFDENKPQERMNTMFIWSFRMSRRELIIIGVGLVVFIAAIIAIIGAAGADDASAVLGGYTAEAADEAGRVAFLEQFGWEVEPEPVKVREVRLPEQPDDRFAEYNALQVRQGFDLTGFLGKRVKLWTYSVTNYPAGGSAVANLLILDGRVIGGDISSTKVDGFSHGFDPQRFSEETAAAQAEAHAIDRTVPDSIPAQEDAPTEEELEKEGE